MTPPPLKKFRYEFPPMEPHFVEAPSPKAVVAFIKRTYPHNYDEVLPTPKLFGASAIPATRVGDMDNTVMEPSPFGAEVTVPSRPEAPAEPAPVSVTQPATEVVPTPEPMEGSVPTLPGFADDEALELAQGVLVAGRRGGGGGGRCRAFCHAQS